MTLDILVPFWGDPALLRACVRSVLEQTDADWRLLVVDDCYPDDTVAPWVEGLGDSRVGYVRNETNLGITDNYRRCLDLAVHDWMVFLGCDDLLLPDYVATVRAAVDRYAGDEAVDIVQPGVRVVDEHGERVRPLADVVKRRLFQPRLDGPTVLHGEDLAVSLLRGNWLYWPSLAFRTESLRRQSFLDGFPLVQDLALVLDLTMAGSRLLVLPDEVFAYRRHAASASSATLVKGGRFAGEHEYFAIAARRCQERRWPRGASAARAHLASRIHAASLVPAALRARQWSSALKLAHHTMRRSLR
ncbi:MAG: glycosyltransferase family 2 protein [Nocardioides sp.]